MTREQITQYSDDELSSLVYNIESLYNIRQNWDILKGELDSLYIYTPSQLEELKNDLEEEFRV